MMSRQNDLFSALAEYPKRLRYNWRIIAEHGRRAKKPPRIGIGRSIAMVLGAVVVIAITGLLFDADARAAAGELPDFVRRFFGRITRYGKSDWLLIPPGLLVIIVGLGDWRHVGRRNAGAWAEIAAFMFVLVLVVAASGLLTDALKALVGRSRPAFVDGGAFEFAPLTFGGYANYSFPSGHATTMGAVAEVLALGPPGWRVAGVIMALLVAVSRVVIGVHYPSDVLAGLLVGTVVSFLIVRSMAYGGYGYRRIEGGGMAWRFGVISRLRRRQGWLSAMLPALWMALRPRQASGRRP